MVQADSVPVAGTATKCDSSLASKSIPSSAAVLFQETSLGCIGIASWDCGKGSWRWCMVETAYCGGGHKAQARSAAWLQLLQTGYLTDPTAKDLIVSKYLHLHESQAISKLILWVSF